MNLDDICKCISEKKDSEKNKIGSFSMLRKLRLQKSEFIKHIDTL